MYTGKYTVAVTGTSNLVVRTSDPIFQDTERVGWPKAVEYPEEY
jgi:hypothetical protein